MYRNRMASQHDFAMVPRADIPRSTYSLQQKRKQTMNAGNLTPIYCEEILPGDHFQGQTNVFARLATPITAVLDNAAFETFFFFVPNRILWANWEKFIGGEAYTTPKLSPYQLSDISVGDIFDQFGLPVTGQLTTTMNNLIQVLPFRAYNRIYNDWFRDENLVTPAPVLTGDGPDACTNYQLKARAKKHDYFTSALPWAQKGTAVTIPLGTRAPIYTTGTTGDSFRVQDQIGVGTDSRQLNTSGAVGVWSALTGALANTWADLTTATAATINSLRQAFQIQRLLERDARGGTRYTELIQAHFGVRPPDYRLDRPEYIGGGKTMITTTPIAQTSATGLTGGTAPLGNLAGFTTVNGQHRFSYAATEHGYIIGLANVQCDITYQQGMRRHWQRNTRYDYYFPALAHLGEQQVYNYEIYCTGGVADQQAFGYQEKWAELRYTPNENTGLFRSTAAGTIDIWHYGEKFTSLPALNATFIADPSFSVLSRSLAVGAGANGQQILLDVLHEVRATRPMPTYSVPGLIDHF